MRTVPPASNFKLATPGSALKYTALATSVSAAPTTTVAPESDRRSLIVATMCRDVVSSGIVAGIQLPLTRPLPSSIRGFQTSAPQRMLS